MESKKINTIQFDDKNIDKYVDLEIKENIKKFSIDKCEVEKISIPNDLKKSAKIPFKNVKKEKRKNIRYVILDIIIVSIFLLPVIGIINPNVFEKIPTIYPIFKNINKTIQIENLKSIMGISKGNEIIEGSMDSSVITVFIEEKDVSEPSSNNESIKLIHSLANTLVQAEYKWECSEVTPKTIKIALEGVEKIDDDYDRMHLRNCLKKWSKGDFSNAVSVHNYVWEMLGGNVGKAKDLNNEVINEILDKYYKTHDANINNK